MTTAKFTSSPQSSGNRTNQNTPSTNLTNYSPGESSKAAPTRVDKGKQKATDGDIFLNAPLTGFGNTQLSPNAETFTPRNLGPFPNVGLPNGPAGVSNHLPLAVPAVLGPVGCASLRVAPAHNNLTIVPFTRNHRSLLSEVVVQNGTLSMVEGTFRSFVVENVSSNWTHKDLVVMFSNTKYRSLHDFDTTDLNTLGRFVLSFHDLRDARQAYVEAVNTDPTWSLVLTTRKALATQNQSAFASRMSAHEGVIFVTVFFDGRNPPVAETILPELTSALSKVGNIKAMHSMPPKQSNLREFQVEYYNTNHARLAANRLDKLNIKGCPIAVEIYQPDVPGMRAEWFVSHRADSPSDSREMHFDTLPAMESPPRPAALLIARPTATSSVRPTATPTARPNAAPTTRPTQITPPASQTSGNEQISLTGRSTVPADQDLSMRFAQMALNVNQSPRRRRSGRYSRPEREGNQVDIVRIQDGRDVRTTVMLRNIPNKVDIHMLKRILDKYSFGCYDFVYLRIDFANNCNVGYAFINFSHPMNIIAFYCSVAGQRWNAFNSDKIAEISYATIQGRDCLIQKFRNSSVMLEHPSFRPKLFIAGNHPHAGAEEEFPPPDNWSKMRRSVDNAEQIGLFRPGSHQHGRGFGHRSQYFAPARASLPQSHAHSALVDPTSPLDPFFGRL